MVARRNRRRSRIGVELKKGGKVLIPRRCKKEEQTAVMEGVG